MAIAWPQDNEHDDFPRQVIPRYIACCKEPAPSLWHGKFNRCPRQRRVLVGHRIDSAGLEDLPPWFVNVPWDAWFV